MRAAPLFLAAVLTASIATGQQAALDVPGNLLLNPRADAGSAEWQARGDASIELASGTACFVIRNKGEFTQKVKLPANAAGMFLVALGRGASERINADGAITGLPYLYGLVATADGTRYVAYLQAPTAVSQSRTPNEWSVLWAILQVPEGAASLIFQLKQAERRGVPQNGSAARFDDLLLALTATKKDAEALVARYQRTHAGQPPR